MVQTTIAKKPKLLQDRRNFSTTALNSLTRVPREDVPYQTQESDPGKIIRGLMAQDSPYMEQATTAGKQYAQSRGLLNSSIAAGAVEGERIRAALPLAQQQASQAAAQNLSDQGFRQSRAIQGDQISSSEFQQGRDIESRELQQLRDIENTQGLAAAQRQLDRQMQEIGIKADRQAQIRDIASREGMAAADRALRQTLQQREITYQTSERELDREQQRELATWNLEENEQQAAASMLTNINAAHEQAIAAINQSQQLNKDQRRNQIEAANNRRQAQVNLVRQLFDVDIRFP